MTTIHVDEWKAFLSKRGTPVIITGLCHGFYWHDSFLLLATGKIIQMNNAVAVELLRRMIRIRMVEETIAERYSEWKIRCPTHLCSGQEAIAAAVGLVLGVDDFVVCSHRSHGHYLAKGGDLNKMMAEIYGKRTGCCAGRGGSMHLIDKDVGFMGSTSIVGGTIPVSVGLALSIKMHGTNQVSCVFFGDGAIEEGVFYESVNFAVLKKLPVLFICENNLYSVYSPLIKRQPNGRSIYQMVGAMGIKAEHGDGNNALEVYSKISSSIKGIRDGGGPCFFEFATYRWREHCGPNFDNDIGYRTEKEYLDWKARDPVLLLQSDLMRQHVVCLKDVEKMRKASQVEIEQAFDYAETSPFPSPEEVFEHLYRD